MVTGPMLTAHDAKGPEIIAGWLDKDGLVEPSAMLRRLAASHSPAMAAAAPVDEREALADRDGYLRGFSDGWDRGFAHGRAGSAGISETLLSTIVRAARIGKFYVEGYGKAHQFLKDAGLPADPSAPHQAALAPADEREAVIKEIAVALDNAPGHYRVGNCAEFVRQLAARAAASPAAEAVAIVGPLRDDQHQRAISLYMSLPHSWDSAETVITMVSASAYANGARDAAPQPTQADAPAEARQLGVLCASHNRARPFVFTPAANAVIPYEGIPVFSVAGAQADAPGDAGSGDAIARSKQILALVDDYHEKPTADSRTALRQALMVEFETVPPSARMASLTDDQKASCAAAADLAEANGLSGIAKDLRDLLNGADHA
ncbi:hypothetical protein WK82_31750 [Burkholderia ubonensis]|nr:hypothetical protein WK82_31750 [Burkholderia ubonensis]